jgi:hypothetical protein
MYILRKSLMRSLIVALRSSLLFFVLVFNNNVSGDVIRLPLPVAGLVNGAPMAAIPAPNTFWGFALANAAVIPAAFVAPINWQLLGYAAFFSAAGTTQLYAARKRQFVVVDGVANNNPANGGNLFNYTTNMHTERQLIIAILEQQIASLPIAVAAGEAVVQGAMIIPNIAPPLMGVPALQGDIHIYTARDLCQNAVADNGNFSCVDYYDALAAFVSQVNFHIYFPRNIARLNRDFIAQNQLAANALCNFIQANPVGRFQMAGGWLQYNNAGVWVNLIQQAPLGVWQIQAAVRSGNIRVFAVQVNNCITASVAPGAVVGNPGIFTNLQMDQMLNLVLNSGNVANIQYHPI